MEQFVVAAVESSAKNFAEVANAFYLAQKAVLYPTEPLYNVKKKVRVCAHALLLHCSDAHTRAVCLC